VGPPKCPKCGGEMRCLLQAEFFCPKDCDRVVEKAIDPEKTEPMHRVKVRYSAMDRLVEYYRKYHGRP
jgi:tRNA(Ile2) C34 agmatinyltransferase TiaS